MANQKQELPMVTMFVNESEQNEQFLERTFHKCFLQNFTSFGWGVSDEKIKMWKVNRWWTPSDGKSSHCLWQGELKMYVGDFCLHLKPFIYKVKLLLFTQIGCIVKTKTKTTHTHTHTKETGKCTMTYTRHCIYAPKLVTF